MKVWSALQVHDNKHCGTSAFMFLCIYWGFQAIPLPSL